MERKLAAIFSADVKGYSRLMGEDEEATIRTLTSYRQVMATLIPLHRGRVVDSPGDNLLAEFGSVVDAVQCAVVIQTTLRAENTNLPQDRRMEFRIGINLGDVMVEGARIYGDGVNIAARVEGLAEPGGICISGPVYDQVKGKVSVNFEELGLQQVKNIAEPVRVYHVIPASAERPESKDDSGTDKDVVLAVKPSIAVLAFENMSSETEQEYFSDGITEDIITNLSKISALFVIARNSSFTYKGRAVNVSQVSKELGVRYVLEGSVRKAGNRVRITAQMIDAQTGGHLWAERFDRDLTDIFAVQDEVADAIVSALALKLTAGEQDCLQHRGTDNLEAYDCFLQGREQWWRHTREANAQAQKMFERAIELDDRFATAAAYLSFTHNMDHVNQWGEVPEQSQKLAIEWSERAVAMDESEPSAHIALGIAYLWASRHEDAIIETQRALALEPNCSLGHSVFGWIHHYVGDQAQAIDSLHKAMQLDPHYPEIYLHFLAQAYFQLGRDEDVVSILQRRLVRHSESDISHVLLAATYGHMGRLEDARSEWREALRINPEYSLEHRRRVLPYKDPADLDRIVDGLRKAGLPE